MSKKSLKVNPNYYRFQDMNTTNVLANMLHVELQQSLYYQSKINPEYNKQIDKAANALAKAYQLVSNKENECKKKIKVLNL